MSNKISTNLNDLLRDEPTILAPPPKRFNIKPFAGLAIAASLALVAVLTIQNNNHDIGSASIKAPAVAVTTAPLPMWTETFEFSDSQVLPAAATPSDLSESIANQRLNNYLMDHSGYRSNVGVNGIFPYVRMVTIQSQE